MNRARLTWTGKNIINLINNGKMTFDNAVQRALVWDKERKSYLIHSLMMDYPVPPLYIKKTDEKNDVLDGKQRTNTLLEFINDKFALTGIPDVVIDGEIFDVNGKKFSELPEVLKERIMDYTFDAIYFDDISDDQVADIFFRLNNGKPVAAIDLNRCKAKSIIVINTLGKHEIFNNVLSKKALESHKNEDIVMKTYIMLYMQNPSLMTKDIRPYMQDAVINDIEKVSISEVYDRILKANKIVGDVIVDKKIAAKVAKKMVTPTHMLSIAPFVLRSLNDGMSDRQFAEWFITFFNDKRKTSVSSIYNDAARSGGNKKENIKRRHDELEKSWEIFFKPFYDVVPKGVKVTDVNVKPKETAVIPVETAAEVDDQIPGQVCITGINLSDIMPKPEIDNDETIESVAESTSDVIEVIEQAEDDSDVTEDTEVDEVTEVGTENSKENDEEESDSWDDFINDVISEMETENVAEDEETEEVHKEEPCESCEDALFGGIFDENNENEESEKQIA